MVSMQKLIRIFFWGMIISFLGALPLGTLNVAAMQISIEESVKNAILFSIGALLVEMIYVRLSLIGIDWVRKQEKLMKLMEWITLVMIIALAIGSFYSAVNSNGSTKNVLLQNNIPRFLLGMLMCSINPVQIPFWFGWSTVLLNKKILSQEKNQYNTYIIGIGLGTLLGNCIFIFGGRWAAEKIAGSQQYINWVIGSIFALTAVIQLWKMLRKKDAMSEFTKQKENAENV